MKKVTEGRNRQGSFSSRFLPLFTARCSWFIFLALLPLGVNAQTFPGDGLPPGDVSVTIMPFTGDDLAVSAQLQDKAAGEIHTLPGFIPRPISAGQFPEYLGLRPDEPPDPSIPGNSPLVLTGEYYRDSESIEHLQLWLWNSNTGALVYTDEMVFEDPEEAAGYLPPLVAWIFSNIPQPPKRPAEILSKPAEVPAEVPAETPAEKTSAEEDSGGRPAFPRLYLGLRGGASFNIYGIRGTGAYQSGSVKSIGLAAALTMEVRVLRFLSVQAEAGFNMESFKAVTVKQQGNEEIFTHDLYKPASFQIPLLLKVPLSFGKLRPALYFGSYYILPLLPIKGPGGSYSYRVNPPVGIIWGMDLGYTLGSGELFFDLRYEMDLGMTILRAAALQYTQNRISMSLGYGTAFETTF